MRIYDLRALRAGGMRDGEALGDGGCVHVLSAHDAEVYSAAWHPVHETLLATGGYNGSLIYWEVGAIKASLRSKQPSPQLMKMPFGLWTGIRTAT